MTVEGEHVYRVSMMGALVHNNCPPGAPNNISRPLTAADLGVQGNITQLNGTFSVTGGRAVVQIDMIEGLVQNPFEISQEPLGRRQGTGRNVSPNRRYSRQRTPFTCILARLRASILWCDRYHQHTPVIKSFGRH